MSQLFCSTGAAPSNLGTIKVLCPSCKEEVEISLPSHTEDDQPAPDIKRFLSRTEDAEQNSSKKTRSDGPMTIQDETGRKWVEGMPVYVKTNDGVKPGRIYKIHTSTKTIVVEVNGPDGWVIPKTVNNHNYDPIPFEYARRYLRERDPKLDGATNAEMRQIRCIKHHSSSKPFGSKVGNSCVDEILLHQQSESYLPSLIKSVMQCKDVEEVVKLATGSENCSAVHALAYLLGQFSGTELGTAIGNGNDTASSVLSGLFNSTGSSYDGFCQTDCNVTKVFLTSLMVTRTRRASSSDPSMVFTGMYERD